MGTVADKLIYLQGTKDAIKTAIEGKGVTVADGTTFRSYADLIDDIETGSSSGSGSGGGSGTGSGEVQAANLELGSVHPTGLDFTLEPDEGYDGFSSVSVDGDTELVPENIVSGHSIYGIDGTFELQNGTATPTGTDFTLEPEEGYSGFSSVNVEGDYNLKPENIADGITIYGIVGTLALRNMTSDIPSEYLSKLETAQALYTGNYVSLMIFETSRYIGFGFLQTGFNIESYNSETTEFTASNWANVSYDKELSTWTTHDWSSSTSTGGNYIGNIRYCNIVLMYDGTQIYPAVSSPVTIGSGSSGGSETVPSAYLEGYNHARSLYTGEYEALAIFSNGTYTTYGFLLDSFVVTDYNTSSREFAAEGWVAVIYNKSAETWSVSDYSTVASTGGHFIGNIVYCNVILVYNGQQIYPIITSGESGSGSGGSGSGGTVNPSPGIYISLGTGVFPELIIGTVVEVV